MASEYRLLSVIEQHSVYFAGTRCCKHQQVMKHENNAEFTTVSNFSDEQNTVFNTIFTTFYWKKYIFLHLQLYIGRNIFYILIHLL